MKRILCITANMNAGGAETFLMKIYRCIDKSLYQMDFCVASEENFYKEEIYLLGGNIHYIPAKSKHPFKSFFSIYKIVKDYRYDYVMRVNEHSLSTVDLLAAKLGGAKITVMRSSNSSSGSILSTFLHNLFKFLPRNIPDIMIAPSTLAAKYTFGKRNVENNRVKLLNNGLNIEKFEFSAEQREKIRLELGIESQLVVGHVGRFNKQKNHEFLLRIFCDVLKIRSDAVLLLIGNGTLIEEIKEKAMTMGIYDNCIFLGVRDDVHEILSAMDVFVFPSLYEGMPNTVIEAQTSGLPCLISNTITKEADVSGLVEYESLCTDPCVWAQKVISMKNTDRLFTARVMKESGYGIESVTKKFISYVFNEEAE